MKTTIARSPEEYVSLYKGGMLLAALSIPPGLEEGLFSYLSGLSDPDLDVRYLIANCLLKGIGCQEDITKGLEETHALADLDYAPAQNRLGVYLSVGDGIGQDAKASAMWMERAANKGYVPAISNLGLAYENGDGVEKDPAKAFSLYEKAAKLGYDVAQYRLSICYVRQIGTGFDEDKAVEWLLKAAEQGHAKAQYSAANAYKNGISVAIDLKQAFHWFSLSAEQGSPDAQYELGCCYQFGEGTNKDLDKAFFWLHQAAEQGVANAQFRVGVCYMQGDGTKKDEEKGFAWNVKAAKQGVPEAQYNVALCLDYGHGTAKDQVAAFMWYCQAAEGGHIDAQFDLGICYQYGEGTTVNLDLAIHWYEEAAKNGHPKAQVNLGACFLNGIGTSVDMEKAVYWYSKAAEQGNPDALFDLGLCYASGEGIEIDDKKAFECYLKAAEGGQAKAQFNLGVCFQNGDGTEVDSDKAVYWFEKSADNGEANAQFIMGYCCLEGKITPKDLSKARHYLELALSNGFTMAAEYLEEAKADLQAEEESRAGIIQSYRKDVFISWNHLDKGIKDDIKGLLEKENVFSCFDSDRDMHGDISEALKAAISSSKLYLIILTGNSIKSEWVKQELSVALGRFSTAGQLNRIKPVVFDLIDDDGAYRKFDVAKAVMAFEPTNPFRRLYESCSSSFPDYDKETIVSSALSSSQESNIVSFVREGLEICDVEQYLRRLAKRFSHFELALKSTIDSVNTKNGIISASLPTDSGFVNRTVMGQDGKEVSFDDVTNNRCSFVYGEGGSGKSLYVKANALSLLKSGKTIFYVPARNAANHQEFLKAVEAEIANCAYEPNDGPVPKTGSDYQGSPVFDQALIVVDGMDEIADLQKKRLCEMIKPFGDSYPKACFLFVSRNPGDIVLIEQGAGLTATAYTMAPLSQEQLMAIFTNISSTYKPQSDNGFTPDKDYFFGCIETLDEDIKKNPLLLSNLAFIYLSSYQIPKTKYEIIQRSLDLVLKDLNDSKGITLDTIPEIKSIDFNSALMEIAFQKALNPEKPIKDVITGSSFIKPVAPDIQDKIIVSLINYLHRSSILNGEAISHTIYNAYFAASYVYHKVYETKTDEELSEAYVALKRSQRDLPGEDTFLLNHYSKRFLSLETDMWSMVASDLLMKLDYEVYYANQQLGMDQFNLSFPAFEKTLRAYSEMPKCHLASIKDDTEGMYYQEFVSRSFEGN